MPSLSVAINTWRAIVEDLIFEVGTGADQVPELQLEVKMYQ
jgi:hypothetical protein